MKHSFISFLNLSKNNLNAIKLKDKKGASLLEGYDALIKLSRNLKTSYDGQVARNGGNSDAEVLIREAYSRFYAKHIDVVSQYIRFFNQILIFVDDCKLDEKQKYWNLIRDQLRSEELVILFYHAWTNDDFISLDVLMKRNFFKYLRSDDLFDEELHKNKLEIGST